MVRETGLFRSARAALWSPTALTAHRAVIHPRRFNSRFPTIIQKQPKRPVDDSAVWCAKRDLNPYGKTTRPSNVRVCQFRHSRKNSSIIAKTVLFVKPFFKKSPFLFLPPATAGCFWLPVITTARRHTPCSPALCPADEKIFDFCHFFSKNLLTFRYHYDIILMSKRLQEERDGVTVRFAGLSGDHVWQLIRKSKCPCGFQVTYTPTWPCGRRRIFARSTGRSNTCSLPASRSEKRAVHFHRPIRIPDLMILPAAPASYNIGGKSLGCRRIPFIPHAVRYFFAYFSLFSAYLPSCLASKRPAVL